MFKMFNTFIEISDKPKSDHFRIFNVITQKPVDDGHHFCQKWRSYFLLDLHKRPWSYYRRFSTMTGALDKVILSQIYGTRWDWGEWGAFRHQYLTNHKVILRWLRNIQTPLLDKPQGETEVIEEHSDALTWQNTRWDWCDWGTFRRPYLTNHKVRLRWLRNIQTPLLDKPQGETEGDWRAFRHQYLTNSRSKNGVLDTRSFKRHIQAGSL